MSAHHEASCITHHMALKYSLVPVSKHTKSISFDLLSVTLFTWKAKGCWLDSSQRHTCPGLKLHEDNRVGRPAVMTPCGKRRSQKELKPSL